MNSILKQVIIKKRGDLLEKKKSLSIEKLKKQKGEKNQGEVFYKAITEAVNNPAIIGEVKFASLSVGDLGLVKDLLERVKLYESGGVDAISVITEPHFFKGNLDSVVKVKETVVLPVLQKDFVIDEYQIYEARLLSDKQGATEGQARLRCASARQAADALLLIARLVDNKTLRYFVNVCLEVGIEPVVEIFSEEDLEKAVATETRFVAVNARDLDTLEVNVLRACELMKKIPERFVRLGFSGIQTRAELLQYREAGARGVLIGTSLMQAKDVSGFLGRIRG